MEIRWASKQDYAWLKQHDRHIKQHILENCIADKRLLVAEEEALIGWLRYSLFWDAIPFMNMLFLLPPFQGKGYGTMLVRQWEQEMHQQGYKTVMTSTQANETAQHFYRKLGYIDIGSFMPPGEPLELLLQKELK